MIVEEEQGDHYVQFRVWPAEYDTVAKIAKITFENGKMSISEGLCLYQDQWISPRPENAYKEYEQALKKREFLRLEATCGCNQKDNESKINKIDFLKVVASNPTVGLLI